MKKHYDQIKYVYHLTHLLKLKLTGDRYLKAIGKVSGAGGAGGSRPKQHTHTHTHTHTHVSVPKISVTRQKIGLAKYSRPVCDLFTNRFTMVELGVILFSSTL